MKFNKKKNLGNIFEEKGNKLKEKTINDYVKKLKFLEKSILKNLRNYFTKNELKELHLLFNKEILLQ